MTNDIPPQGPQLYRYHLLGSTKFHEYYFESNEEFEAHKNRMNVIWKCIHGFGNSGVISE